MSRTTAAWLVIALAGVGTFAVRAVFLLAAERMTALPRRAREALRMIPPAALAALVAPAVLRPEGALVVLHPRPIAAAVALVVALWTRSMLVTIAVGLAAVAALDAIPGLG